jgi:hypothetical protein
LGKFCFNFKLEAFDNNADANEAIEVDADKADKANKADVAENKANKANLIIVANKVEEADETSVAGAANVKVAIATNKADLANTTSPVIIGTKVSAYFLPTSCLLPAYFPPTPRFY